jgi:hypothetical protein
MMSMMMMMTTMMIMSESESELLSIRLLEAILRNKCTACLAMLHLVPHEFSVYLRLVLEEVLLCSCARDETKFRNIGKIALPVF